MKILLSYKIRCLLLLPDMLIGFMGIKGSGKDICADHLVKNYGFVKKSFADPLKRACQELFLFSNDQLYGTQEQKETPDSRWFNCTPRIALQYVGTDLLREQLDRAMPGLEKNIFTHHFKIWYDDQKKKNPSVKVVVADVRFQNEIDLIQGLGGVVIKLDRPSVATDDMHPSEMELQKIITYDCLLSNIGTRDNLYKLLDNYLNSRGIHNINFVQTIIRYSPFSGLSQFLEAGFKFFNIK